MKLIKTSNEHETFYFSSVSKAAHWLKAAHSNVSTTLSGKRKYCNGYTCEWIESDDILSRYIDVEYGTHMNGTHINKSTK